MKINCRVVQGHQVASGRAVNSPFPSSTIAMQKPIFAALGLDLVDVFNGTINLELIDIKAVKLNNVDFQFKQVKWSDGFPAEDFSFINCQLIVADTCYSAFIYQPHKETKVAHFQPANILEILAPPITNLDYGDTVTLVVSKQKLALFS